MKGAEDVHQLLASYKSYEWAPFNAEALSIGFVLYQWSAYNKLYCKVVADICTKLNISNSTVNSTSLCLQVKKTVDKFNHLKRNVGRNWQRIEEFLSSDFTLPALKTPQTVTVPVDPCPSPIVSSESPKKLRKNCDVCPLQRKCNENLAQQLKVVKSEKRRTIAEIKRDYKTKVINQRLKRHAKRRADLVADLTSANRACSNIWSKFERKKAEVRQMKSKISSLESKISSLESNVQSLVQDKEALGREVRQLKKDRTDQEHVISHLTCPLEESQSQTLPIASRPSKAYIPPVRLCVYKALLCQVPVSRIGHLIEYIVRTLGGHALSQVPSQTTVAQMAFELGALSFIQLGDFLLNHKNLCISWDATSLDGSHINEIHVTADQTKCMTIDIQALPGGTAQDYTTHVVTALSDAASTFARYHGIKEAEVSAKIHQSMTATVTDRAAVNHATVVKLREALRSQLLELNCNVHPLDSMASASRSAPNAFDKENSLTGRCLGRNGAAITNCIMAVSKLR